MVSAQSVEIVIDLHVSRPTPGIIILSVSPDPDIGQVEPREGINIVIRHIEYKSAGHGISSEIVKPIRPTKNVFIVFTNVLIEMLGIGVIQTEEIAIIDVRGEETPG